MEQRNLRQFSHPHWPAGIVSHFKGIFCTGIASVKACWMEVNFDWTKMKQTDIFAEIDDHLKIHSGHVSGGFAQPSIVDFYTELSEHVFYSEILKNPVGKWK